MPTNALVAGRPAAAASRPRRPVGSWARPTRTRDASVPPRPPAAGPPAFNPQNTPEPLATPNPSLSAPDAVAAQVAALAADDDPWPGHGVQAAYGFARDTGDLELSTYFRPAGAGEAPLRRSLYHEDHYAGTFRTSFPELLPPPGAAWPPPVVSPDAAPPPPDALRPEDGAGCVDVAVEAGPADKRARYVFRMQRAGRGRRAGAWLTAAVTREGGV